WVVTATALETVPNVPRSARGRSNPHPQRMVRDHHAKIRHPHRVPVALPLDTLQVFGLPFLPNGSEEPPGPPPDTLARLLDQPYALAVAFLLLNTTSPHWYVAVSPWR